METEKNKKIEVNVISPKLGDNSIFWDLWCSGGPARTRYSRSKSGWFEALSFKDWFFTLALPYFKKLSGKEAIIGDNLSFHADIDVIKSCQANDIKFIFLPSNSSHLTQPLDVAFFGPLKKNDIKF